MNRFGAVMAEKIIEAHKAGLKVSVMDDDGNLLWFSPDWSEKTGQMKNPREALGRRWMEFVHSSCIDDVQRWLRDRSDSAEVRFIAHSGTLNNQWIVCAMVKRRVGLYWLAVGDNRIARPHEVPSDELPGMGCAIV
jgi:hypothetical protein